MADDRLAAFLADYAGVCTQAGTASASVDDIIMLVALILSGTIPASVTQH